MIAVDAALARVRASCRLQAVETLALEQALGRVLAEDLQAPESLPPFDNSAMDGFAVHCGGAGLPAGRAFEVTGSQAAGDAEPEVPGTCCEIMTGALLPRAFDAVVPIEQVEVIARDARDRPIGIRLQAEVRPGQHVRRAGEDITSGERLLAAGTRLGSRQMLVLAGLGIGRVPVRVAPKVALLCTGRELVDDPAQALQPGQIRNSNGPHLAARLQQAGAELVHRTSVPDDADAYCAALEAALQAGAQIIISTGAVSMGRHDFVPTALQRLGAEVLFHKVAMRPGKPLLFARLTGGQQVFGLPGNPVSSAVGLRFFIEPALRALLGMPPEKPWRLPLAAPVHKKAGFRLHQKARLQLQADGRLQVVLLDGQESFKTLPLMRANAWAVLPETADHLAAGTLVDVLPLDHETEPLFCE